jgi:hypothetical protein
MRKPVYRHPNFVTKTEAKRTEDKRYWLKLTINENKKESLIVILKNPSRATKDISDKTVFNVTNYIYKNSNRYKQLKNVGTIIILNLIPNYETYSENLLNITSNIIDRQNLKTIDNFSSQHNNVIIAWGNPPKGLKNEYNKIKEEVLLTLKKNKNHIYYIHKLSALGNPKHGQIWAYKDKMIEYNFNNKTS